MHLESSKGWGGQEIRILKEAILLREKGYRILFGVEKGALLKEFAEKEGFFVREFSFKKPSWIATFFSLRKWMRKEKVDLINTHSSLDSWIGGITAKSLKKKVLRTRHLSTPIKKGLNSKILYKYLADFVVTTCKKIVSVIVSQSEMDPKKCRSIPTGVSVDNFKVDEREKMEWPKTFQFKETDFIVGTTCFMRSWKGMDDLLQAAFLLKEKKDIKFLLIGGGNKDFYQKSAKDMGLENVYFTGHLEKPFSAMVNLDVFTLLSTAHEGVSQASLQAAFLKKPLITTNVGGLPEVCIDEKTGIVVPTFSPESVKKAILFFYENQDQSKAFGKNAKELVLEKFTQDQMVKEIEEVYQTLFPEEIFSKNV